ncbi:MAG: transglycosylase SLT domain-containing protein [Bacteroidota bacterium]
MDNSAENNGQNPENPDSGNHAADPAQNNAADSITGNEPSAKPYPETPERLSFAERIGANTTGGSKNKSFKLGLGRAGTWYGANKDRLHRSQVIFLTLMCLGLLLYIFMFLTERPNLPVFSGMETSGLVIAPDIPDSVNFAGEAVPLNDEDVYERFDKELIQTTYFQSATLLLMKRSHRWFPQMEPILKQYGVPDDFKYVAGIESNFENKVSPRGAAGYWQIMEPAGREFGLEINDEVDERYHAIKATHAACKYFLRVRKVFGNWTSALASYNVGMGSLYRSLRAQKMTSYYDLLVNSETSRYVFRLLAVKEIMQNGQKYGFVVKNKHFYAPIATRKVRVSASIPDLAAWAIGNGINYKILKMHNPWLRKNTLTIGKAGKFYEIDIPLHPNMSTQASDIEAPVDSVASDTAAPGGEPDEATRALEDKGEDPASAGLDVAAAAAEKPTAANSRENERKSAKTREEDTNYKKATPDFHVVKNGESLGGIAQKYGMSQAKLAKINKLKSLRIQRGQKLRLKE